MPEALPSIVSVSLNTAIDRILEVPNLQIGGHVRGHLVSIQPAGKAVNVARILGLLGTPCILTGFIGEGDRPRFERSFAKTPVRIELFEAAGHTRENITLIDPARGQETHVRDVGFPLTDDDVERLSRKLHILSTKGAYVHFGGSLPPKFRPAALRMLLDLGRRRGAYVSVDTSGAGLEAVRKADDLWLLKPNRLELAELTGLKVDSEEQLFAAAEALRRRVEEVIVTVGADGAYLFVREGAWRARPQVDPHSIVKTVGCGDALLAGFLKSHAEGLEPADCLRQAVATGTAAAFQQCAGVVAPKDVKAVYRSVLVDRVR
jgi:1-phosphofructokinase family hexose kinase